MIRLLCFLLLVTYCNRFDRVEQPLSSPQLNDSSTLKEEKFVQAIEFTVSSNREGDKFTYFDSLSLEERAKKLNELYTKIKNANSDTKTELEHEFFRIFPDDYETFVSIYGWKGWPNPELEGILYGLEYYPQIEYFLDIGKVIPYEVFIRKLIRISLGGEWEADEVDAVQRKIIQMMMDQKELFLLALSEHTSEDLIKFWIFYFDGPHPPKEIPEYLAFIQEANPEMYTLIEETLKQA